MKKTLIDAGPLIALFDKSDNYHDRCIKFIKKYRGRLVTSWAVVTEVLYMLDFCVEAQVDFLRWLQRDAVEIFPLDKESIARIIDFSKIYADLPMDFADATLMVISELEKIHDIITIDSEFLIYRNLRKEILNNIFNTY